jgi:hypothetical protein
MKAMAETFLLSMNIEEPALENQRARPWARIEDKRGRVCESAAILTAPTELTMTRAGALEVDFNQGRSKFME